jgi:hypothetical protein
MLAFFLLFVFGLVTSSAGDKRESHNEAESK